MFNIENIGLILIIIIISLMVIDTANNGNGLLFILGIIIFGLIIFSNITYKDEFLKFNKIKIHSTAGEYNNITSSFFLGTGFINSQEMYKANIYDGKAYERIYIPVKNTKRIITSYLIDKAIYKEPICSQKSTWLFYSNKINKCSSDIKKGELLIPKNTIIKQLNFQ